MSTLTTSKIAVTYFEQVLETIEDQVMMADVVDVYTPDAKEMQNSGNVVQRPVEMQANLLDGWDLQGQEQGIIQEAYFATLGEPRNDWVKQRADDMRDDQFWKKRGKRAGKQQIVDLNKAIANVVATQGSLVYTSSAANGLDFISEAQALLNEQQRDNTERCFFLNDRSTQKFASELAGRQTLAGRPETDAWAKGQIGENVAEFNIYTASFLPNLAGGASPDTTVVGDQTFKPEGGTVDVGGGIVTNTDYRYMDIPVVDASGYSVGDKVRFDNAGTTVKAVGISDQTDTGTARTAAIVAINGNTVTFTPKFIAADDPGLTPLQKKYANVDTRILTGATMERVNTAVSAKTNLFFDKDAVEIIGGSIPAELMNQFAGKQVLTETFRNGLSMYFVYDGNIEDMTFRFRCFMWYGVNLRDPQRAGVALVS